MEACAKKGWALRKLWVDAGGREGDGVEVRDGH